MAQSYWIGFNPLHCDLCQADIVDEFIDGATAMGPWGFMCPPCHRLHGRGLGTGRGQHYQRQEGTERFVKVES